MDYETLLYEEESDTLDFKQEQYKFIGATDREKGELLKDVLAFANAWKRSDAYILIGVEEVKGGKSNVVGVEHHLDDAAIQQFVNSKTQRPVLFSYTTVALEDKKVGVIHIPLQNRPVYLKSDFGALKANVVYLRRGTTTAIASPDEVFAMGRAKHDLEAAPVLELRFADLEARTQLEASATLVVSVLSIPRRADIPDFDDPKTRSPFGNFAMLTHRHANSDYYRELIYYYYETLRSKVLGFAIYNPSPTLANDVRAEIAVPKMSEAFTLFESDDLPDMPHQYIDLFRPHVRPLSEQIRSANYVPDVSIVETGESWLVSVKYDKVQAKQTLFSRSAIAIAFKKTCQFECAVTIYCDNLPDPIRSTLIVSANTSHSDGGLTAVEQMHKKRLMDWMSKRQEDLDR
jgi:Putative DNA-binding domain